MGDKVMIRQLLSIGELREVRKLESKTWGNIDSTPVHQTLTVSKNGGFVLGAYVGGELVGFQYSFPGFDGTSVYLCSHMLAIDPRFRNRGIGEKLKHAQREQARQMGYSLIRWTYDPLESINGYLNIGKLGAVCSTYIENCYGEMNDHLNSGLPSDRFQVEWRINRPEETRRRVGENKVQEAGNACVIQWRVNERGLPVADQIDLSMAEKYDTVYVAIPAKFQHLKEIDISVARQWRLKTRAVFTHYFAGGWEVTNFIKNINQEIPVNFYEMQKSS
ncbi:GNAT family N-acetyltransferase [Paenactinomyces guangxiensis]|uniref:GNAT family N-acetyltransferase n=1 Tax=Paenactinomyces guangxiensis TaxID=1490290 RepID=A0A7W1WPW3_9BACL|nr:GNAT family N-acetyltransferase [Paenactinomyces guangxiensis]MBA4493887.1 GNAT family N-acetyltransferase [Paenactinomyces guangxiensis]MBH8591353.1 GNAT family N-acetyltransferase [Paenactinomyces guangxiensis]